MNVHVRNRKLLRKGRVFDFTLESIDLPNGVSVDMEIIRHPGASAIVALTDDEEVLMLRQYRHAVGRVLWEIPAGTFEREEAPLACARRELVEETGFGARTWDAMGAVTPVPGYSDEKIFLFLARDLTPDSQKLDPDELIEVDKIAIKRVESMIMNGEIDDAKTIAAVFRALHMLKTMS